MIWAHMTDHEKFWTLRTMEERGGGFASALAVAWQRADLGNAYALSRTFPDLITKYGPTSDLYLGASAEV